MSFPPSHIKNIIFDLGGVLLNIDYFLTEQAFIDLGISEFPKLYSQARQTSLFDDLETGRISGAAFKNQLTQIAGVEIETDQFEQAWNAMLLDIPNSHMDFLTDIQSRYRIFLLSNTNAIHYASFQQSLKDTHGIDRLDSFFEKAYYSHLMGMRKPNRSTFETVLAENNLLAGETLFIDDSVQHVEGAKAAGIVTHHLQRQELTELFAT